MIADATWRVCPVPCFCQLTKAALSLNGFFWRDNLKYQLPNWEANGSLALQGLLGCNQCPQLPTLLHRMEKLGSLLLHCNLCVCWCFFSNVFRYKITGCWVAGPERGHKYNKIKSCGYDAHWVLTWFPARGRTCKGHQFQVEPLVTMFKHIVKPCWTPNTTDPNRSGGVARNIVPSQFRYGSNLAAEFLPVSGVFHFPNYPIPEDTWSMCRI